MKTATTLLLWVTATLSVAHPSPRDGYAVKDTHVVPPDWTRRHRATADHRVNLRIGLKQASFDELERRLYEVSDPDHELYGQHLSSDEVNRLVSPRPDALAAAHEWLHAHGVDLDTLEYSPAKDWIIVTLPVRDVETLLDTEYHVYESDLGEKLVRTPEYSLPLSLHEHVDVVQPTNSFDSPRAWSNSLTATESAPEHDDLAESDDGESSDLGKICDAKRVTIRCIRTLYGTRGYIPQVPDKNFAAVTAYDNQTANISDFHIFMSKQRPDSNPTYVFNYTTIHGGVDDQHRVTNKQLLDGITDGEADLDSQAVGGLVYPTRFQVYSTGGVAPFIPDDENSVGELPPFLAWVHYMLRLEKLPHTVSTSYASDEQNFPLSYARRTCQDMAQLGARGTTLFFSSGDYGVGIKGDCFSNTGDHKRMFLPRFPSTCPYVTSVGATRNFDPEVVADAGEYHSGSGLSNYFLRPAYQAKAVAKYLDSIGDLNTHLYNHSGRAYPDVAAQGFHFVSTYRGTNRIVDGTSISSPVMNGVFTLINDRLIAGGRKPLGFLNPALYKSLHTGFTDVTNGTSAGCGTRGFPAGVGWDLASGWGTPRFDDIYDAAIGQNDTYSG